jgi:hypothetical protein
MFASASVFLDFNLPNATTWFYFSFLLAMALFFKFSRLLSYRNWDVVLLFLLTPGLLLIHRSRPGQSPPDVDTLVKVASLVGRQAPDMTQGWVRPVSGMAALGQDDLLSAPTPWVWIGYLWLLVGSAYLFIRCLFDLALVQRPVLEPNLSFGGLAWLAGALFVCLLAVAFRQPDRSQSVPTQPMVVGQGVQSASGPIGRESAWLPLAREGLAAYPWVGQSFAGLCHLAVIVGLVLVGQRHFHDARAGMAAATFYLMLPYTGLYVSQVHHVWPMALLVWTLVAYRIPTLGGILLGVAAGTAYFPALVFPLWLSFYWKRGSGRFLVAFFLAAFLCLAGPAFILAMEGELEPTLKDVMDQNAWQPWKVPTTEGFWTGVHWAYRIPVFLAYLAFVLATACWPAPKNLAHVIALSAAVIIGIQFWYADQGGVYVLWYLPLLMLLMFRPNLADRRPDPIQPGLDWLSRLGQACLRALRWLFRFLVRTPPQEEKVR